MEEFRAAGLLVTVRLVVPPLVVPCQLDGGSGPCTVVVVVRFETAGVAAITRRLMEDLVDPKYPPLV
jgi:hypothetical protein